MRLPIRSQHLARLSKIDRSSKGVVETLYNATGFHFVRLAKSIKIFSPTEGLPFQLGCLRGSEVSDIFPPTSDWATSGPINTWNVEVGFEAGFIWQLTRSPDFAQISEMQVCLGTFRPFEFNGSLRP